MKKYNLTKREKQYEEVYATYADDVYKICIYYLKDEEKAKEIATQALVNFYEIFDKVDSRYILGFLVREIKRLLSSSQGRQFTDEEVKECVMNGKK